MALKKYYVIYNRAVSPTRVSGRTVSKAEAEKIHGKLGSTEANAVVIPDQQPESAHIVKLEAESAEAAAIAVRLFLGADGRELEFLVAEEANLAKAKYT